MGIVKEFRDFAMRGNVIDMAVGIIIGASFGTIVKTLVDKVMMPPLGYLLGGVDFADKKYVLTEAVVEGVGADGAAIAAQPEVAIYYGEFINATINFVIVAFALFIVIRLMNEARKRMDKQVEEAPATPAAIPADVALLTEIRDLLKVR
jgi:large conductance mechanosensitive channel